MNPSRVLVLLIGLPSLTLAQVCTDIEDNTERLACYDANNEASSTLPKVLAAPAEQNVPPALAETPAREPDNRAGTKIAAEAPDDFGREEPFDAPREYIEANIIEIATAGEIDYLRLDNGQVWREVEDSHMRFKEGRKVTITEGILSSYDLKMEGYNKKVKVKRHR
ncbi:MAG: hypothetical protein GWP67_06580 [Gammaproteobacteria bacterium]|jgi:hypothetical protein|nr:hypothetical protein [Gammaproteobacteria bacterium]